MTDAQETARFFDLASTLATARRAGDARAAWEAADDLEVMAMHTENPKLRDRASAAVSNTWASAPAPSV